MHTHTHTNTAAPQYTISIGLTEAQTTKHRIRWPSILTFAVVYIRVHMNMYICLQLCCWDIALCWELVDVMYSDRYRNT